MSGRHVPIDEDDDFIPKPVWFAQQLGWCNGPQGIRSWDWLLNIAVLRYWQAKPEPRQEHARAV